MDARALPNKIFLEQRDELTQLAGGCFSQGGAPTKRIKLEAASGFEPLHRSQNRKKTRSDNQ
jgi:hypothetical protein